MSGEHDKNGSRLTTRARKLFDESVENLDVTTRGRLARARARALDRAAARPAVIAHLLGASQWLVAGGALAAAALVAVVLWQAPALRDARVEVAALDDLELMLAEDEFDMLEELEFYAWLEEQPELEVPEPADDGVG